MPVASLDAFVRSTPRLFVLTGAGCSTASGIPAYRDETGAWKHKPPVQFQDFITSAATRQRYWARSMVGWARVAAAAPTMAHRALAKLERCGVVAALVTQNVDGLHQKAGSDAVIDLHGRLDTVRCLQCGGAVSRASIQRELVSRNPRWADHVAQEAPDGDARVEGSFEDVSVPDCETCGGVLKPDVVFFGENVPKARVADAYGALGQSDGVLVVGSSLMVFSGYRFCLAAAEMGKPVALVNRGKTRADELAQLKVEGDCGEVLSELLERRDGALAELRP
jgi:NAD-dependent SIR2 family protein deacetylase